MIEHFEQMNKLDSQLIKYDESMLDQLYLRVFNTDDGLLILRDLEHRCFVNKPTINDRTEGMRNVYLSIVTRMANAVTKKKEVSDVS